MCISLSSVFGELPYTILYFSIIVTMAAGYSIDIQHVADYGLDYLKSREKNRTFKFSYRLEL